MKFTQSFSIPVISLLATALLLGSCKRDYDEPPHIDIPVGNILTIAELRALHEGEDVYFDDGHYSVYATVTADESSGNIYRNIFAQDETGSIVMRLNTPGGIYQGDSVRIYLPGSILSIFPDNTPNIDGGMMQLDSIDVDQNIIKQATNVHVEPQLVTIDEIDPTLQARLVRIENVEFVTSSLGQTFADAENQQDESHDLTDCDGNTIEVRNSSYANFADEMIPEGNGSIIAVVDQFNDGMQLKIRDYEEVQMNGERCDGGGSGEDAYLSKDFSDYSITSGGWLNYVVLSDPEPHEWEADDFPSGNPYAVASGLDGFQGSVPQFSATELWMISPAVDLSDATSPGLTFRNASRYDGNMLRLMVSSDYDGSSDPSQQGTWTDYSQSVTWDTNINSFSWTNSDVVPMTQFNGQNSVYVAFKYTSTANSSATWEVDDILIEEQ